MRTLETTEQFCSRLKLDPETLTALESAGIVLTRTIGTMRFSVQIADIAGEAPSSDSNYSKAVNVVRRLLQRRHRATYKYISQFVSSYNIRKELLVRVLDDLVTSGEITVQDAVRDTEKIYSISA